MRKELIVLYLILISFKVYGYPDEGWGGENNYSSTTGINPTITTTIVVGFLLFVGYVAFRVWRGLKNDKDKPTEDEKN